MPMKPRPAAAATMGLRTMASAIASAQVLLFVNGNMVGQVSDFQWTSVTNHGVTYGLDSALPVELPPTTCLVQGSMTVYRTLGDGGAEGMGVTTQFQDVMRQQYTTLALVERSSGLPLFQCSYTQFNTQQWNLVAKGLMQGQLTFVGVSAVSELAQAPA